MKKWMIISAVVLVCAGFSSLVNEFEPVAIPASPQRLGGNPDSGYQYLITGDYVKGGIPYSMYVLGIGKSRENYLNRNGKNEKVSYEYTAITAPNGEVVVAPNCLQCHAQVFDDKLIMGLGNTFIDFTYNQKLNVKNLQRVEGFLKATAPKKYEASADFIEVTKTVGPYLSTHVRGVNSADRLAAVLAAHRDPVTFKWIPDAQLQIPNEVVPTDVPAWWILKKKNAMFYNGFGRGDFGKFLMASNLLTVKDTSESAEVDKHMPDVLAYIYSLKPPAYPKAIDHDLAKEGEKIYSKNCQGCHGSRDSYPNLLIPGELIQTDSLLYTSNYSNPQFVDWFNRSWFTTGDHPAQLVPFNGYIAPPLDGVWITAPYLHNGSVPTLETLLNSKLRPAFWSRTFRNDDYNYDEVGWNYKVVPEAKGRNVYNTTLPGYGNHGHYYGDKLTEAERKAVIEYLKTL